MFCNRLAGTVGAESEVFTSRARTRTHVYLHQGMTFGIVWKFLDDCIFRGQCPELLQGA